MEVTAQIQIKALLTTSVWHDSNSMALLQELFRHCCCFRNIIEAHSVVRWIKFWLHVNSWVNSRVLTVLQILSLLDS